MSREQIEEMAKEICEICRRDGECINVKKSIVCKDAYIEAEHLYNAGYRKQSEGEWLVYGNVNNRRAMCTNCRKEFAVQKGMLQLQHFPNCPLCGSRMRNAKMKGGAEQ